MPLNQWNLNRNLGTPGRTRTCDQWVRKPTPSENSGQIQPNEEPQGDGEGLVFPGVSKAWAFGLAETQRVEFEAIAADAAIQAWCRSYADSLANALATGGAS